MSKNIFINPPILRKELIRNYDNARELTIDFFALLRSRAAKNYSASTPNTNWLKYKSRNIVIRLLLRKFFHSLSSFLKKIPIRARLLDCGCAEGFSMQLIKKDRGDILFFGIDTDLSALQEAQKRNPFAYFIQADARSLPFKEDVFSEVLALEMLEHIDGDPADVLREIKRVSSGRIVASVPHEPFFSLANLFMGRRIMQLGKDPEHMHSWGKRSFCRIMERYFIITKVVFPFPFIMVEAMKNDAK